MKNLKNKIEGMTDSYWNIIDFEDRKQLNTEIEALIRPLVEALNNINNLNAKYTFNYQSDYRLYSNEVNALVHKVLKELEE